MKNNASQRKTIVVICENCSQKLSIPKRNKRLRVTCPKCRHSFRYRYYGLGFSSQSKFLFLKNKNKFHRKRPVPKHQHHYDSHPSDNSEALTVVFGLLLLVGGCVLVAGNRSGVFPTLPFAGFIISSIGLAILRNVK